MKRCAPAWRASSRPSASTTAPGRSPRPPWRARNASLAGSRRGSRGPASRACARRRGRRGARARGPASLRSSPSGKRKPLERRRRDARRACSSGPCRGRRRRARGRRRRARSGRSRARPRRAARRARPSRRAARARCSGRTGWGSPPPRWPASHGSTTPARNSARRSSERCGRPSPCASARARADRLRRAAAALAVGRRVRPQLERDGDGARARRARAATALSTPPLIATSDAAGRRARAPRPRAPRRRARGAARRRRARPRGAWPAESPPSSAAIACGPMRAASSSVRALRERRRRARRPRSRCRSRGRRSRPRDALAVERDRHAHEVAARGAAGRARVRAGDRLPAPVRALRDARPAPSAPSMARASNRRPSAAAHRGKLEGRYRSSATMLDATASPPPRRLRARGRARRARARGARRGRDGADELRRRRRAARCAPAARRSASLAPPRRRCSLTVVLAPRDPAGLARARDAPSRPRARRDYHRYLSVAQFAARFGAAPATRRRGRRGAARAGPARRERSSPDGLSRPRQRRRAPARPARSASACAAGASRAGAASSPTTPRRACRPRCTALVAGVLGLDNVPVAAPASLIRARARPHARAALANQSTGSPAAACREASQFAAAGRALHDRPDRRRLRVRRALPRGDLGAGVTVAIFELEPYQRRPTSRTSRAASAPARRSRTSRSTAGRPPAPAQVGRDPARHRERDRRRPVEPASTSTRGPTAPPGSSTRSRRSSDNGAVKVISDSWGLCEPRTPVRRSARCENTLLQEAAAQGQTFLVASGDLGAARLPEQPREPRRRRLGEPAVGDRRRRDRAAVARPAARARAPGPRPGHGSFQGGGGGVSTLWPMPLVADRRPA